MNLLDNELVKKYFHPGCNDDPCYLAHNHEALMAYRVLAAMQEPIKQGELYINLHGDMKEPHRMQGGDYQGDLHYHLLRLPDAFQPKAEKPVFAGFTEQEIIALRYYCDMVKQTPRELKTSVEPKAEKCACGRQQGWEHTPYRCGEKPEPVEEKMVDIWIKRSGLMQELRDLIALARGSK